MTVLNDILDYSKLEAGRFELDSAVFDLHELIKSVGNELQARAREKGVLGAVNVGTSCPRFVKGDASRVRQVLTNLTDNAVKFTSRGSVRMHANAGDADGKLKLRFDVTDTGIGFGEFQKQRLFQPYAQAATTAANMAAPDSAFPSPGGCPADGRRDRLRERAGPREPVLVHRSPTERAEAAPSKEARGRRQAHRPCPRGRGQCREPHADRRLSRGIRAHLRHRREAAQRRSSGSRRRNTTSC